MVRGRYEFIPRARHRARGVFDGRGFSNGHRAAQYPWVAGHCSIELRPTECSSKLLEGHIRQGPDVGE